MSRRNRYGWRCDECDHDNGQRYSSRISARMDETRHRHDGCPGLAFRALMDPPTTAQNNVPAKTHTLGQARNRNENGAITDGGSP